MSNEFYLHLDFEHKVLIVLYVLSYFVAMFIQVRDPKTIVRASDWFLGFVSSSIGGTIAYFFVMKWANIGLRMGITILFSLVSYRLFCFIVSEEAQNAFAKGFWQGIINMVSQFLNNKHNDNYDNQGHQ